MWRTTCRQPSSLLELAVIKAQFTRYGECLPRTETARAGGVRGIVSQTRRYWLAAAVVAVFVLGSTRLDAADGAHEWLTSAAFREQLTLPATVLWADSPIREYLLNFGRTQRVAVLLDRRVDPDQELSLTVREEPVMTVIRSIATEGNLRTAVIRNIVYVGPPPSAERIRTVVELRRRETAALGAIVSRKFAKQAPLSWQDFAAPRELLGELAQQNGIEIVNLDRVPHDLWAGCDLPPLSLIERLTLILHQFDLTFQTAADGRRVAVAPVPPDVAIVRDYPGGSSGKSLAEKWRATAPNCEFRIAGNRVYVRGLIEDLERIEGMGTPGREPAGSEGGKEPAAALSKRFTASVPNRPLGAVLAHFAAQLGLELRIDDASLQKADVSLEQLISFRVENATFDELFQEMLAPVGCKHERQGNVLNVWAKP